MTSVIRAISAAVNAGRFLWRHKRLTLPLAVGLLIVALLLTGAGFGTIVLNLAGLGIVALVVRRIVQARKHFKAALARNTRR